MQIAVLGGSGFIGQRLCARLLRHGHQLRVLTRNPERARQRCPEGVEIDACDVYRRVDLLSGLAGCEGVVFLPGILHGNENEFFRTHVTLVEQVIQICREKGIRRLLHMSALGANPGGPSLYLRTKGEGENRVIQSGLDWTVFRPSVVFGEGDQFINLFAQLVQKAPVLPLARAETRLQPVWVEDVVQAFAVALEKPETIMGRYDLVGPVVYTLREIVEFCARQQNRRVMIMPLGERLGRLQARLFEHLPGHLLSRDNLDSLSIDNISSDGFAKVFGIEPGHMEYIAQSFLSRR